MVEVIRDATWFEYLKDALEHYKTETPNKKCVQYANAFWRHKTCAEAIKVRKRERCVRKLK